MLSFALPNNAKVSVTIALSQGQHLERGSRLTDFDITVGDAVCVPVSLTDSQVDCRPPTDKPNRSINGASCPDDALLISVRIHCGYYEHDTVFLQLR